MLIGSMLKRNQMQNKTPENDFQVFFIALKLQRIGRYKYRGVK